MCFIHYFNVSVSWVYVSRSSIPAGLVCVWYQTEENLQGFPSASGLLLLQVNSARYSLALIISSEILLIGRGHVMGNGWINLHVQYVFGLCVYSPSGVFSGADYTIATTIDVDRRCSVIQTALNVQMW